MNQLCTNVDRSQSVFYFVPQESHSQAGSTTQTVVYFKEVSYNSQWESPQGQKVSDQMKLVKEK